jgi:misacylated tRNA(Ala) deacylase
MSNTQQLFREDSYAKSCDAEVLGVNDLGGIILDRTVFYPAGGGQPGDTGALLRADGTSIPIATTVYENDRSTIVHVPDSGASVVEPGDKVQCVLDWERRYAHMRVHTALHLLCATLPYPVTGGSIGEGQGRLDFDIPDAGLDKDVLSSELTRLADRELPVVMSWIADAELEAKPDLVRTMAVKPPTGSGKVRMIAVGDVDFQPCGGTHVANTREIGPVRVSKIEKKGAQNRRVRIVLS